MSPEVSAEPAQVGWRIKVGFALFILSLCWPAVGALTALAGASAATVSAVSGVMFIVGEVMAIAAIAIAGKEGFSFIKAKVMGVFKRRIGPPREVGKVRYVIGLLMFTAPFVVGWALPYVWADAEPKQRIYVALACDVVFLISLFVLGGNFWSKLRSLFAYSAYAVFPKAKSAEPQSS